MQMGCSRPQFAPRRSEAPLGSSAFMLPALRIAAVAVLAAAVLPGCESKPAQNVRAFLKTTGESDLKAGIRHYESGRLTEASQSFNAALRNGLTGDDEVTANKYLAFIACSNKRERQCRAYFLRAMELKPDFDLTAAEAENPAWGPVFKTLKDRR
jgi:Tfp pilus assembly protein PilF